MTIGAITLPSSSPNLIHKSLSGFKNLEFINPKTKKIMANGIGQILNSPDENIKGHNDIKLNTMKKSIPKLLLELILSINPYYIIAIKLSNLLSSRLNFVFRSHST